MSATTSNWVISSGTSGGYSPPAMVIDSLDTLRMKGRLDVGDVLIFHCPSFRIELVVNPGHLENQRGGNADIFQALGINDYQNFCDSSYGYGNRGGGFPAYQMGDLQAAFRVTHNLFVEFNTKYNQQSMPSSSSTKKLNTKELDKLVIDEGVKKEITSVLKQHEHKKKIFDDWGLGEVIEYGRGMTFLFHGSPGTGKTWASHCIAKAMGMDLLEISSAEIQSSEPGGACRAIKEAFLEAKRNNKVLLFDECDSLITVRAAVGMILASEINTLLTELEKFEGICILSTNRIGSLDEALERRIALICDFPEPTMEQRKDIWTLMLPKKMPLHKDVTIDDLATYNLTGGLIKNSLLGAARLAIADDSDKVKKEHFKKSFARVLKSKSLMGKIRFAGGAKNLVDDSDVETGAGTDVERTVEKIREMAKAGGGK